MDETLLRAYEGKSASRGGLNAKAFKDRLIEQYPKKAKKIRACKTRGTLTECCAEDKNMCASFKRAQKSYSAKSPRRVARRTVRRTRSPPRSPVLRTPVLRARSSINDTSSKRAQKSYPTKSPRRIAGRTVIKTRYPPRSPVLRTRYPPRSPVLRTRYPPRSPVLRTRYPPRSPVLRAQSPADPEESDCGCSMEMAPKTPTYIPEESEDSDCGCSMAMAPKTPKKSYFKDSTNLSKKQQSYCRCVAHVAAKNPASCYGGSSPEWKKGAKSRGCTNPYQICAGSVGTSASCYDQYDFRRIRTNEVRALRRLHGKR